jgi:hypothetical protein
MVLLMKVSDFLNLVFIRNIKLISKPFEMSSSISYLVSTLIKTLLTESQLLQYVLQFLN